MARAAAKSDAVTWPQLALIVVIALAVLGGMWAVMRGDLNDLKQQQRESNTALGDIKAAIATTNGKLDMLIAEARKGK